ncbi:NlpC/P60 family protein [Amycolatopsis sp. cg5]|uniref:NlpC/P60 family protein n=1 Tax=Amycolatopsis sp. cg5 TaxID=3238802 RepID=UPI0035243FDB
MKSHPVKRVVSGALAATAVIAAVSVPQAPAIAAPVPALQAPPGSASEALTKYRELATQAEKINEEYLKATDDLKDREADLQKAGTDVEAAKAAGAAAGVEVDKFRVEVDKFAGASFTSGVQLNKVSALLSGASTQEFLERAAALDVLATDKNNALKGLTGAVDQAKAAENAATAAQTASQTARDAAAKLQGEIDAKKKSLDAQIDELEKAYSFLNPSDKNAQKDQGGARPNVKAPGAAAQSAVDAALSKLGSPYAWGKTGPGSFDCSGLMVWAFKQAGITLKNRSSAAMASSEGVAVSRDQLAPGDMVFFGSPVHHVGMYIGDGKMVHAPTTGDVVKISPLQSGYAGARRVA